MCSFRPVVRSLAANLDLSLVLQREPRILLETRLGQVKRSVAQWRIASRLTVAGGAFVVVAWAKEANSQFHGEIVQGEEFEFKGV